MEDLGELIACKELGVWVQAYLYRMKGSRNNISS